MADISVTINSSGAVSAVPIQPTISVRVSGVIQEAPAPAVPADYDLKVYLDGVLQATESIFAGNSYTINITL